MLCAVIVMTLENVKKLKPGDTIFFSDSFYEVAEIKEFPHGLMVGIYDDPATKHIDYLNPESINLVLPCYACQGGGCPVCSGIGVIIY